MLSLSSVGCAVWGVLRVGLPICCVVYQLLPQQGQLRLQVPVFEGAGWMKPTHVGALVSRLHLPPSCLWGLVLPWSQTLAYL